MGKFATFCDAVVDAVAPKRGNQRLAARIQRQRYHEAKEAARNKARRDPSEDTPQGRQRFSAGGFRSADTTGDLANFMKSGLSIDSALEADREEMIGRVDVCAKNYELAWNHIEGRVVRVAGVGMTVDPEIGVLDDDTSDDDQFDEINQTLREGWERQCERIGRNGEELWEIQHQLQRDWERRGEWFLLVGDACDPLAPVSLKVEVIDPDRVSTPDDKAGDTTVRMGIQLRDGIAVGCYIRTTQPGDLLSSDRKWNYHPFTLPNGLPRVIHHFARIFRGQHRGFPAMQVGTKRLHNSEDYNEAEVDRLFVSTCLVGVTHSALDPDDAAESFGAITDSSGKRVREMSPGMFYVANDSEGIEFNNPNGPTGTFEPFMQYQGRMFSAGCNTNLALLDGDWRGLSYSTARIIWNNEDAITAVLQLGQKKTLKWIYRHYVTRAILVGMVDIDIVEYRANPWPFWKARIIAPPKPSIDPSREDRNEMVNIEGGMKPGGDMAERINGKPSREVYRAVARDRRMRKKYGLEEHLPQMGRDQELQPADNAVPTQAGDTNQKSSDANSRQEAAA